MLVLEQQDICIGEKNEALFLFHTLHKNQLNMECNLNVRPEAIKFLEKKTSGKLFSITT